MSTDGGDIVAALYVAESAAMRRLAFLICGDLEDAEEAVQDAFLQLHSRRASLREPGAYLRTAVVNNCRSRLRRRSTARRWIPPRVRVAVQEPDEMGDALGRLGERQRIALVMRYYLDSSDAEIAAALGVRPSTVRSLLRRGLDQLRKEFGRDES